MDQQIKQVLIRIAQGKEPAQLVLKNVGIVNVFTESIEVGDVAISHGYIAGIGNYQGERELDLTGKFLSPGFIDTHAHFESSMVSPNLLAGQIVPWGTTTLVADPHEIVNVLGLAGVEYLLQETEGIPLNVYVMLPSCIPATPFEHNGAQFTAEDMRRVMHHPRVLGLGEMMDYPSVLAGDNQVLEKIELFTGKKTVDGHAPGVYGKQLQAYKLAGIDTDHECANYEEARAKISAGMHVLIREGSAAKNLEGILTGAMKEHANMSMFAFCTDDKHLDHIRRDGHIRWNIKKAISLGMEPAQAICMGSWNAAQIYGLRDLGAIAPGFRADLVVLDDLKEMTVHSVYKDGNLVSEGVRPIVIAGHQVDETLTQTVHVAPVDPKKLQISADRQFPVLQITPHSLLTQKVMTTLPQKEGVFVPQDDYLKLAVVERHHATGNVGVGVIHGVGLKNGAIASTIAHDSHNLIVVGDNDEDMLLAIEELKRCQGGYTVVSGGKVLATLQLPIAGLFTNDAALDVTAKTNEMIGICRKLGVVESVDPFITLSFMALPVIPEIRVTDMGVFDVTSFSFLQ